MAFGLFGSDAHALALGRVTVQSALGEPLRAEIDIPEINAEEAASLKSGVASPDAFKAAGLEYSPVMTGLQVSLQRRPDGRAYLRLSSDRPISDPFIDLILETSWSSGRIVRDYTMLFDPPNLRQGGVAPMTAAQLPAPSPTSSPRVMPAPVAAAPGNRTAPASSAPPAARAAAKAPPSGAKQVTVSSGDTAGRIAAAHKPDHVSLDQMLVALLHANPDAFIGGNVNRIKAGSVLDIPTAEQAAAAPGGEASKTILAQSRDFNEFRRRLAQGAPDTQLAAADRKAAGKLQANVEDKRPTTAAPDKLTLSKGAVGTKAGEDKIASKREAKDTQARVAELSKNIDELAKLQA
ncbi:MAG: type IV pilus assembly protein FimV, partial [Burkholderiaceae bacterium]